MKATIDTYSHHFHSAARSLVRCSRRTSDNQGLEGAGRAGLEETGQMSSRQEDKVRGVAIGQARQANAWGAAF